MTTRSTIDKRIQLGVEVTAGTEVDANRRVPSLDVQWSPNLMVQDFRPAGNKIASTSVVHGAEMAGTYSGILDYNSLIYPLAGLIGVEGGALTTPGGGTNSRKWRFVPTVSGRDTQQKTYTIEKGDSSAAQLATYCQFNSLTIDWTRTALNISGGLFGRFPTDGSTLTASPTTVAQRPVAGGQVDIFVDTTWAGIGTTKVTDAYKGRFSLGDKFTRFWALNTSNTSFKDTAEQASDVSFGFATAHNAQSRAFFNALDDNTTYFIRLLCEGATLEGAIKEKVQIDMVGRFRSAEEEDVDGVYGYNYTLTLIEDATFNAAAGGAYLFEMINLLTLATAGFA